MSFDRHQIEARLTLDLIASRDMPKIAWDALEAGLDGPATRRLSALDRPNYFEVAEVLPDVKRELELSPISVGEAAVRVARHIAEDLLSSGDDPLKHLRDFESLWVRSGYAHEISVLGTLYDDVWIKQSTGLPEQLIREHVIFTLKHFVRG
jgi:hypothetical protein